MKPKKEVVYSWATVRLSLTIMVPVIWISGSVVAWMRS